MWLRPAQARELERLAREGAPEEICGLLLGHGREVVEVVPVLNMATARTTAFRLDERAFVAALFAGEKRGLSLVGFYHSHPDGIAIPSQTDIQQALYPDALHLIIGLAGEPVMAAWRLERGMADAVELYIGEQTPPRLENQTFGRAILFIGAFAAFVILIVLSLALLPPAPPLPAP